MKSNNNNKLHSILLILLAAFLGGATSPLTKITVKEIPPFSLTLLRFIIAGIFMIPIFLKSYTIKTTKNIRQLLIISLLATLNVVLFAFGVRITSATVATMLYLAAPLIIAILSYFILKESMGWTKISGICLGLLGTLIVLVLPLLTGKSVQGMSFLGNVIILIGVLSFSLYSVISKRTQTVNSISPSALTLFFIITTIIFQLVLAPLDLIYYPRWWYHLSAYSIFGLFYVGIISTGLYYFIFQYAIKIGSPVTASMILYLQPFSAYLWSYLLLKEKLSAGFIFGLILALIGVALTNYSKRPILSK